MSDDPRAYLTDVLANADAATEGPWDYYRPHFMSGEMALTGGQSGTDTLAEGLRESDALHITQSRTTSPAMARALIAVLDQCERVLPEPDARSESDWTHSDYLALGQSIVVKAIKDAITTELAKEIEHD